MAKLINYASQCVEVPVHPHGSREWLIERGNTVGASEIGKALGVSPYGGLLSLVLDKRKAFNNAPESVSTEAMQDGQDAEATILRMAWRRLSAYGPSYTLEPGVALSLGACSATPDGLIVFDSGTVRAVIEAKLDRSRNTDWSEVADGGFEHLTGQDIRLSYWWQVQQQLYVTGCLYGYLAVWTVFDFWLIRIEASAEAAKVLSEAAESVMGWVKDPAERLPAATDADSLRTIASTIRPATEGPIDVGPEVAVAMASYVSLGKQIDALEEQRDAAKRIILEAHSAGAKLASADGIKSSYISASERVSIDTKALEADHPQLVSAYKKVSQIAASCRVTAPRSKG
jgi:predicted phage-related endonuclease